MTRRPPQSKRMQGRIAKRMATDFEETPLHNTVYDTVQEDDQLARLLDATATADAAGDLRVSYLGEDIDRIGDIEAAEGVLADVADDRAREAVAEACADVIRDGDQWADEGHWEETTIDGAKHEAREWLQLHTNEAARVGVLEEASN